MQEDEGKLWKGRKIMERKENYGKESNCCFL
jgi:hypothetical protein